ncbi:peptidase M32 [Fervidicella metallireducens AeB]|uniref:Metal-dependent carboxypeptidase n=2 Tax=Fervidicella TaxID=1403538 RepID=A0A017RUB3_9CLOT|nr:peptidase M32 [Fervidicella metallireducens AeB]
MEKLQENITELKEQIKKMEYLGNALGVLYWDMRTGIPKKAIPYRGEILGYLSSELYKLQTSEKIKELMDYFKNVDELDDVTKAMVENVKKDYERTKKIPADKYREFVILQSAAEAKWEEAKEKSDFNIFKPYLEKLVNTTKEFLEYWGYEGNKYNTLLDFYEPGVTVEKLDKVFTELREAIVDLLNRIKNSRYSPDTEFFRGHYPRNTQEKLGKLILDKIGYDFEAGRLDESMHPFTVNFGNKDVRVTTHYYENDFLSSVFSCIHEGGHAIYEQQIPDELIGTGLAGGTSMGIHESQSRFYENVIGRSIEFWSYFYPELTAIYPQFKDISIEDFYKGINKIQPSLIRVEADELTYSLHIIIRYEIEKQLINGEINVDELPKVWNEKYKEYLGIEPANDSEGVLQDMHWSAGNFGYFPSYALGNLYGAQFFNKMKKDIPDVYEKVARGEFNIIKDWLRDNIHKYGKIYEPVELIKRVTGEELTAKYFIEYLNAKYSRIYNL